MIDYLKLCRLYKGQKTLQDNPLNKDEDEFKWYMWRIESNAVRLAKESGSKDENEVEEIMKTEILAGIHMYAHGPYGGDATKWIDKYFSY